MNLTFYIFGSMNSGYVQYPDNYTTDIFKDFYKMSTAPTQLITHREGQLIYYGYIRKLADNQYIGLCLLSNGAMVKHVESLFSIFENSISMMTTGGHLIGLDSQGNIVARTDNFYSHENELKEITDSLQHSVSRLKWIALPAEDFSIANDDKKTFTVDDRPEDITEATSKYAYVVVYKSKDYDTAELTGYRGVVRSLNEKNQKLCESNKDLKNQVRKLKVQQKNMKWVAILGVLILILGFVIWNKVLFPSEVTHFETGEFVYFGPLNDRQQPNGVGVAIYPNNDKQKRKYYVGNFSNGQRVDDNAMLLYQDGSYYYGKMQNDKWLKGIAYNASDNSSFIGTFQNNLPYNGTQYIHEKAYNYENGNQELAY